MPFIQAPLAGYTDHPMRLLAKQHGCPLTFTGVMLDKIAVHPKAIKLKKFHPQARSRKRCPKPRRSFWKSAMT
ncbi:MAG: hypothetical protein ACYSUT_06410 [Planctomycetota bacterium]|jgi:tRNA-dihydrouridine synthase